MAFKLIEAAQERWRAVNAPTSSRSSAPGPLRMRQARSASCLVSAALVSAAEDVRFELAGVAPNTLSNNADQCSRLAATVRGLRGCAARGRR